eukprot:Gb_09721 [translate_table: standard]
MLIRIPLDSSTESPLRIFLGSSTIPQTSRHCKSSMELPVVHPWPLKRCNHRSMLRFYCSNRTLTVHQRPNPMKLLRPICICKQVLLFHFTTRGSNRVIHKSMAANRLIHLPIQIH